MERINAIIAAIAKAIVMVIVALSATAMLAAPVILIFGLPLYWMGWIDFDLPAWLGG